MNSPKSRIPLSEPDLRGREADNLAACVRDNWVSSAGPFVSEFETRLATLTGRQYGVAVVNGTAALHLSLLALGVKPGQKVVVPDWTFAATANAVCHAGATPLFVDVNEESWSLDPLLLEQVLRSESDIAAVIMVDTLGHPAHADSIESICRKAKVRLLEDAAGAIGSKFRNRSCGGIGDAAVFSFNGNKVVTAGGGGMIVSDDKTVAETARALSTQARPGAEYIHSAVGFNYRMTNLNAAVGMAQLDRLDEMVAARRQIAARYDKAIEGRNDVVPMPRCDWAESNCWLYSVRLGSEADASSLVAVLRDENIEARIFWRSLSAQAPWSRAPRSLNGVSAALSGTVVSLPCSSSLDQESQGRVIAVLDQWRGHSASRIAAA